MPTAATLALGSAAATGAEIDEASKPVLRSGGEVAQVYAELRQMILDGTLEPGRRVAQIELSKLTGGGRTPLREALRMLQQEGLVHAVRNKGIRIAPFDLDELDCIYGYRVSMEATATEISVPQLTNAELAELDRTMADMQAAIEIGDRHAFELPHRQFHFLIVSHVQEGALARLALDSDRAERYRRLLMRGDRYALSNADAEHQAITAACHQRDGALAARLMANHLARSAFRICVQLEPTYDPVLTRTALRTVLGTQADTVDKKPLGGRK